MHLSEAIRVAMTNHRTNKRLLLALAEIWNPYTSTFVTAFGEITFTVEDAFMLGRLPKGLEYSHCAVGDLRDEERYYRKQLKDFNDAFTTRNAKKRGSIPLKLLSDQYKDDFSELGFMVFLLYFIFTYIMPSPPGNGYSSAIPFITLARLMNGRRICWASTAVAQLYLGLSEYALELRDRNANISRNQHGMSFNLYGPFWLLPLWAYERFPPLAPAPNSGEGILRGERYGDAKGPQKSTGWYFKIINSE